MKFNRELKVGIFAIIVIGVSWWGIKWLGGQDLLKQSSIYSVYFEDVTGLMESSRVNMRGVAVGNVRDIELIGDSVKVEIAIENGYIKMIPSNSIAEIASAGLMGGMQITILQGDAADCIQDGAVLAGRMKPDMLATLAEQGGELIDGLNRTVEGVNELIDGNSTAITQLVANLESMTSSINGIINSSASDIESVMADLNTFTSTLAANTGRIESMLSNVDQLTTDIAEADFVGQLSGAVGSINSILASIDEGQGSVGKLLTDDNLYTSLNAAGENLAVLLEDLKAHPMRYVHFSLFGKSEAQIAEKEAKKAAKAAKKAAKNGEVAEIEVSE